MKPSPRKFSVTARKIMIISLSLLFLGCLCRDIGYDEYYFSHLPTKPDESYGRIRRINFHHGTIRYGTEKERERLNGPDIWDKASWGAFFIAFILSFMFRDFDRAKSPEEQLWSSGPAPS